MWIAIDGKQPYCPENLLKCTVQPGHDAWSSRSKSAGAPWNPRNTFREKATTMRGADKAQVTGISMKNGSGSHVTTSGAESRGDRPGTKPRQDPIRWAAEDSRSTTRVSDTQRLGYRTALRNDLSWP